MSNSTEERAERGVGLSEPLRLTYKALGERLGISMPAARIKAKRRGWSIHMGNDGRAYVMVTVGELAEARPDTDVAPTVFPVSPAATPSAPPTVPPDPYSLYGGLVDLAHSLQGDLRASREELKEARDRLEESQRELEQTKGKLGETQGRLEEAERHLKETQDRLRQVEMALETTREAPQQLRQPWWRLRSWGVR
jgi:hypothetical protein